MSCTRGCWMGALLLAATAMVACGDGGNDDQNAGGAGGVGGAGGTGGTAPVHAPLIGDGTPESVRFTVIADAEDGLAVPRDLGFHPGREGELWVANRQDDGTTIIFDATGAAENSEHRVDGFAEHFMEEVSSIAFGAQNYRDDWSFGTCQESENTYNDQYAPNYFMGPALWSAHLDVFAINNPEGLGSHLDMLHESPNCMGIAHQSENVYWVFDGHHGQIVRYDFQQDHDAGYDDHSDGIIHFLAEPRVVRVPDVPSHLVMDLESRRLYVADTGNQRILWIDPRGASKVKSMIGKERGTIVEEWGGQEWGELVPASAGLLQAPSGLALHGGYLYVGDNATGEILAFDLEGNLVNRLTTGVAPGALMGLEPGPDDRLYFADATGRIVRIEPAAE
ncbi:hypothetical protein [Vulgatibacter sp.]|uniref:hypothetical protein n=1 Tax=Vulgatibacter sp. TaxID=1971226 RepID=UPI0035660E3A